MTDERSRRIVLLHNPVAGRGESGSVVEALRSGLERSAFEVTSCESAMALGEMLHADSEFDAIICAGGDGTVNAAINIVQRRVPMIPYPLGNENLAAKCLGVRSRVGDVINLVETGVVCEFDVAAYRAVGADCEQRFLLMMSGGFDADVVHRVHQHRTGHISKRNYVLKTFASIRDYRFCPLEIQLMDDQGVSRVLEGHWVFVFNFNRYARGLPVAADADPRDGLLDVCVFRGTSLLKNMGHAATVMLGAHGPWSGCVRVRATQVRISSEAAVPIQIDGDPGGQTPVDVHIVPRGVRLFVPAEMA